MKNFSADLNTLLESGVPVYRVELFAIGPCDNGAYLYATTGQLPVTFNGNVYDPSQYGSWSRGEIVEKIGLESSSVEMTVFADSQVPVYFPGTSNAAELIDGIKFGLLGQAEVAIYCAYYSPYLAGYGYGVTSGPTGGSLVETKFVGMVGPIEESGITRAKISVHDMLYLLNIQVPRRVVQASCSHTLFDVGCALTASSFTKSGAVASVANAYSFTTSAHIAPTSAAGTFALGVLTWTSGANKGLSNAVAAWAPGSSSDTITLEVAPIFAIRAGDAFTVAQGCNKTLTSCSDLQGATNAMIRFGGQPDTPVPETAIG